MASIVTFVLSLIFASILYSSCWDTPAFYPWSPAMFTEGWVAGMGESLRIY